jgi:hypothetical protein
LATTAPLKSTGRDYYPALFLLCTDLIQRYALL